MDKNGWMSKVIPIMGFERGPAARSLCNKDRQKRISSLTPRIKYENPVAPKYKVDTADYYKTISVVMGEKLRIKKNRQELNELQGPANAKTIEREPDPFLAERVEDKMIKTSVDFYSTNSTFYQRGGTAQNNKRDMFRSSKLNKRDKTLSPSKIGRESASPCSKQLSPCQNNRISSRGQAYRDPAPLES